MTRPKPDGFRQVGPGLQSRIPSRFPPATVAQKPEALPTERAAKLSVSPMKSGATWKSAIRMREIRRPHETPTRLCFAETKGQPDHETLRVPPQEEPDGVPERRKDTAHRLRTLPAGGILPEGMTPP